jgi:sulfite reductase (NADPH) flavoprotein alpha-component
VSVVPILPKSAPFTTEEIDALNGLVGRATPLQRAWLAGFLAGLDAAQGQAIQPHAPSRPKAKLTLLYGSESGNAEGLALKARKLAQKQGFDARIVDMAEAELGALAKAENIVVFISTWGEGDPPQRAAEFYRALMSDAAPRLDGVRFAVLALGDTAYVNFCAAGQAIDERLEALGGVRAAPRIDLDLDFARAAASWTESTLTALAPTEAQPSATILHVDFKTASYAEVLDEPAFGAENPLSAEITERVNLNGTGSTSETWHIELATATPGFAYEPGDAIGVLPENDPELAGDLLAAVGLGGDAALAGRLVASYDITTLTRPVVEAYGRLIGRPDVVELAKPERFAAYAADRQLIDLFAEHREKLTPEQLTGLLRRLPARLYSVASSLEAHPGETHLLINAVRWRSHGRDRKGVTSTWLADRRRAGDAVRLYVKPNRHFRLPKDPARPIIMIGAGTGIAPYRAFIEERAETGAKGPSWLIFGARNYTTDFLYQLEWQDHLESGALSRIDVAFSRDQPEKVYVQHRLHEHRSDLMRWIEDGAHLYVCGDEKGMGRDVDVALAQILGKAAGADEATGRARLEELRRAGRYQRDVY